MRTKKYDLFIASLKHLCEAHEVSLEVYGAVWVEDYNGSFVIEDACFMNGTDDTKEPS